MSAPDAVDGTHIAWGLGVSNGIPRSTSGASDLLGGDAMITLGLWDNSVGTEYMQAATLMHELGHTAALRHGGAPASRTASPTIKAL